MRANARNAMWYSLTSLILAVSCTLIKAASEESSDNVLNVGACMVAAGVLMYSATQIWSVVRAFRAQYRVRVLDEHGFKW